MMSNTLCLVACIYTLNRNESIDKLMNLLLSQLVAVERGNPIQKYAICNENITESLSQFLIIFVCLLCVQSAAKRCKAHK